jgi:hypothetical protein
MSFSSSTTHLWALAQRRRRPKSEILMDGAGVHMAAGDVAAKSHPPPAARCRFFVAQTLGAVLTPRVRSCWRSTT